MYVLGVCIYRREVIWDNIAWFRGVRISQFNQSPSSKLMQWNVTGGFRLIFAHNLIVCDGSLGQLCFCLVLSRPLKQTASLLRKISLSNIDFPGVVSGGCKCFGNDSDCQSACSWPCLAKAMNSSHSRLSQVGFVWSCSTQRIVAHLRMWTIKLWSSTNCSTCSYRTCAQRFFFGCQMGFCENLLVARVLGKELWLRSELWQLSYEWASCIFFTREPHGFCLNMMAWRSAFLESFRFRIS